MLGDKAYDSAELREELDERGTRPVIPNRCNRKQPFSFSKRLYKLRWRIESAFNRLKDLRRIATLCVPKTSSGEISILPGKIPCSRTRIPCSAEIIPCFVE
jgi:transposase